MNNMKNIKDKDKLRALDFNKFNLSKTKQRERIYNLLKFSERPLSAEDIFELLEKQDFKIDLSTIYRTLNVFEDRSIIRKALEDIDKSVLYEIEDNHHNHYLLCNICNGLEEINMCPLQDMKNEIEKQKGFIIDYHNLTIRGICKKCYKKQ